MKYQNIVVYLMLPLALLSIPSLLENVQAQTNSTNQTAPQQNQNMNLTTQALMKINIFELKDTLMKANLAIVHGDFKEALTGVRDVETQLFLVEPLPTKFLDNIHKAIKAIARSDTDKALNTLTQLEVTIIKAENQIFKAAVANPQMVQQFDSIFKAAGTNPQMVQQFDSMEPNTNEDFRDEIVTSNEEDDSRDEKVTSNEEEDSRDEKVTSNEEEDLTDELVT